MSEDPVETAVEAKEKDRRAALVIALLALLLALSEAGAKRAQHLSTESNIEAVDLFNFYQAKKIRATIAESGAQLLEAEKAAVADPNAREAFDKQIETFHAAVERYEHEPKHPEDSLEKIQERAHEATEARELANHRLERYEFGSGLTQIAIVLASASIITDIAALLWISIGLGAIGAALVGLGFFLPTALPFLG
ncbi:uncharacterized protein DUF4337 [Roseiarcus fermentans]|uniref:Uncharacterized protein DUF4337 n=1 Tax=Roseiarcus fermentans TaxID=1473586 RepID=A0A366FNZ5_9HYPH|nr:DUF4337 domain-containing protein [Roseiarcus fermentans]RBP16424.1 uncharacterized protein DUF4337 [Roseiarcus fermentans]